jgi:hypothetical protein
MESHQAGRLLLEGFGCALLKTITHGLGGYIAISVSADGVRHSKGMSIPGS